MLLIQLSEVLIYLRSNIWQSSVSGLFIIDQVLVKLEKADLSLVALNNADNDISGFLLV